MLPVMATKKTTKNTQKSFKTSKNASQKHVLHHYFPEGKFSINETKTDITNISGSDHATQNNSNCIR